MTTAETYYFYKIECLDFEKTDCYIGKTKHIYERSKSHKNVSKSSPAKVYQFIRDNGGWSNFKISVIHEEKCSAYTANLVEYALIKSHNATLNTQTPIVYGIEDYNKRKCQEHYSIKKECACGWMGSKMDYAHHIKSKRHTEFDLTLKYQEYHPDDAIQNNTDFIKVI